MEPTVIGVRLASAAIGPLVKKLFVSEGPGAGLVDKPVRISAYVSFRGEKRTLTDADVGRLADRLVRQALRADERPVAADEQQAVTDALAGRASSEETSQLDQKTQAAIPALAGSVRSILVVRRSSWEFRPLR